MKSILPKSGNYYKQFEFPICWEKNYFMYVQQLVGTGYLILNTGTRVLSKH